MSRPVTGVCTKREGFDLALLNERYRTCITGALYRCAWQANYEHTRDSLSFYLMFFKTYLFLKEISKKRY